MSNTKHKWFSVWKIIALVISIGALIYRIISNVINIYGISEYWHDLMVLYMSIYLVYVFTAFISFTKGKLTFIFSIIAAVLSAFMLLYDGFTAFIYMVSTHHYTYSEMGYLPLGNFMLLLASIFNFLGFISIWKRERKQVAT